MYKKILCIFLCVSIFTILSLYPNIYNALIHTHRQWVKLLFIFLNKIANVVETCVIWYFITFNICYTSTLDALVNMIDNYFDLLKSMIYCMTSYPAILYLTINVFICMTCVTIIIWLLNIKIHIYL